jgi:hypothetical protein
MNPQPSKGSECNTSDDSKTSEESRPFNWSQVIEMVERSLINFAFCFLLSAFLVPAFYPGEA